MRAKLQNVAANPIVKKAGAVLMALMMCCTMLMPFACAADVSEVAEPSYAEAATTVYNAVHEVINFNNILAIIGVGIGGMATLYLLWWGIRKVIKMLKSGLNGKLRA